MRKIQPLIELNLFWENLILMKSLVLSCALSSSALPTVLGQVTEMAMAEAWFSVQLTIFVLIWTYFLDHCPVERSNNDPVLVSWQGQEFIMPCTLTRFPKSLEEKQPLHLHHTYIQVFCIGIIFLCQTHHECWLPKSYIFILFDHRTIAFCELQALTFVVKWQERFFPGMPSKSKI